MFAHFLLYVLPRNAYKLRIFISMIKNKYYILLILAVLIPLFIISRTRIYRQAKKTSKISNNSVPQRIVSLAPSITETLFALGMGDRIVGVTQFCDYPDSAKLIAKIGGFYDANYEAIIRLKPDVVILLEEHETAHESLTHMGIPLFTVNHRTLRGIMQSIDTLGIFLGKVQIAQNIVHYWEKHSALVNEQVSELERPSVLMTLERVIDDPGSIYIVGKDGVYDELISIAGGVNAYDGIGIRYPMISREGVLQMNPDVIIENVWKREDMPDAESYLAYWREFKEVKAVKSGNIHMISKSYAIRPGPRFILLLRDIAPLLYPQINWNDVWLSLE